MWVRTLLLPSLVSAVCVYRHTLEFRQVMQFQSKLLGHISSSVERKHLLRGYHGRGVFQLILTRFENIGVFFIEISFESLVLTIAAEYVVTFFLRCSQNTQGANAAIFHVRWGQNLHSRDRVAQSSHPYDSAVSDHGSTHF